MKRKGRRSVRTLAQGALLAASLAMTQFGDTEVDARPRIFDSTLLDRLRAPITRYHD